METMNAQADIETEADTAKGPDEVQIGPVCVRPTREDRPVRPIPDAFADEFGPASHYIYEWTEYLIECADADRVLINGAPVQRDMMEREANCFRLKFENELGLSRVTVMAGDQQVAPEMHLEVLSEKCPEPQQHYRFLRTMVDELYTRAAQLPFRLQGPTARRVETSIRPPSPLFTLHFLCHCQQPLRRAFTAIRRWPYRELEDIRRRVRLPDATEIGPDVLLNILQNPDDWVKSRNMAIADHLKGHAPRRVWQRLAHETLDNPENRFVLAFLKDLSRAADDLSRRSWYGDVPDRKKEAVETVRQTLQRATTESFFDDVGEMTTLPMSSQVLMRREGYRQMLDLWQLFHRSRKPLFAPLQRAMQLRRISELYEFWVFFTLCEKIGELLDKEPELSTPVSDVGGLEHRAMAQFGDAGTLVFNKRFAGRRQSYSLPLRPDFTWMENGQPIVVLDAKFRLDQQEFERTVEQADEEEPQTYTRGRPERTDLYKMHTYRDALGVRAAVAVYPGDTNPFYHTNGHRSHNLNLEKLLRGQCEGIGAIAMEPSDTTIG